MSALDQPVVVVKTYDFTLWLLPKVEKFSRAYRFSVGDRLVSHGLDLLLSLVEAAYSSNKAGLLDRANLDVNAVRYLLRLAKDLGMRTTVTSNGMLLNERRLAILAAHTDVLAISLDGVPESHNRMRASAEAFARMQANLESVRKSGIDFGFIFTLTQHNVNELGWVAQFAAEQGAKLFQIHPLAGVGRAADLLSGSRPDEMESAFAFLEAERIRQEYQDVSGGEKGVHFGG